MNKLKNGALSFAKLVKSKIISIDLYPTTVNFTYEGQDSFKTLFGGLTSLVIQCATLLIAVILMVTIFNKQKTTFNVNKIIRDITNDPTKHYFAQNLDVYFAVRLVGPTPEKTFRSNLLFI